MGQPPFQLKLSASETFAVCRLPYRCLDDGCSAADGERKLTMMRWGMRNFAARQKTNIRIAKSPRWRAWLTPEHRCLAPRRRCEFADTKPKKTPTWFALDSRSLFVFAGI